ncbi:hypothetical protein L6452_16633 [Arctium lappa]|uniref:Uncharacterized protein n=1 Tax=Arctium lappa TaxID=4217 RepID=A0ACB9C182_ARCLA|nr:hypothetical protein L6452_16633 [Arctium lappa]
MDYGHNDSETRRSGSFSRISSTNSSLRRHSLNLVGAVHHEVDDDSDCRSASEAGDIGDIGHFIVEGVLTRYLLENLFGPEVVGATSDQSYMYVDLAPNMVGSFLMGWFGAVYKGDISKFSPEIAVGLTTGYLGSLTIFSGWNQKMLELSVDGNWVFSVLGFLLGLSLVASSFVFGVETAKGFKWTFNRTNLSSKFGFSEQYKSLVARLYNRTKWCMDQILFSTTQRTRLRKDREDEIWMPFGTLIANIVSACIMAAMATMKKAVNYEQTLWRCGNKHTVRFVCTVSTFIAEFGAMRESKHPWRAYVYALTTIIISFSLGTLIFSVPVWTKGWT